ncbi:MAG: hypothetical protein ACREJX_10975, partial [Polyangiaceae bacterium]
MPRVAYGRLACRRESIAKRRENPAWHRENPANLRKLRGSNGHDSPRASHFASVLSSMPSVSAVMSLRP